MAELVERVDPFKNGTELQTFAGVLDFLRATVVLKVAGLTDEQAFSRPVESSDLTPAGVVKHLAAIERWWFSIDFAGLDVPRPWAEGEWHGNFPLAPTDTLAQLVEEYLAECERSRQAVAGASPEDKARGQDMDFNLRYAFTHMVEETARHCGHLDILRERIDGQRGE